ncbi:3480_t:CDS:2 [Entrophospora sp. SA101]|nr:3480_t:CDS:2 [Entrophospora sp. SA101]
MTDRVRFEEISILVQEWKRDENILSDDGEIITEIFISVVTDRVCIHE